MVRRLKDMPRRDWRKTYIVAFSEPCVAVVVSSADYNSGLNIAQLAVKGQNGEVDAKKCQLTMSWSGSVSEDRWRNAWSRASRSTFAGWVVCHTCSSGTHEAASGLRPSFIDCGSVEETSCVTSWEN